MMESFSRTRSSRTLPNPLVSSGCANSVQREAVEAADQILGLRALTLNSGQRPVGHPVALMSRGQKHFVPQLRVGLFLRLADLNFRADSMPSFQAVILDPFTRFLTGAFLLLTGTLPVQPPKGGEWAGQAKACPTNP